MKNLKKRIDPKNQLPLSPEENKLLMDIYIIRRKNLLSAYLILFVFGFLVSRRIDYRDFSGKTHHFEYRKKDDRFSLGRTGMIIINNIWIQTILLSTGIFFYRKRVSCFKKDAESGVKYAVLEQVAFKQYFPMTNQYFVSLNDPAYMHHEVDKAIYDSVNEGDLFPVYFARESEYAFNKNGSFTLL